MSITQQETGITLQEAVQKRKELRTAAEPAEPTEATEVVEASEEAQPPELLSDGEESELNEEELAPTESDEDEDFYVEYKGREISLKDIDEWEQGHLRQSDYTRKTQDLANERKAFESERESFKEKQSKLDDYITRLEVAVKEEEISSEALAEMREYEPEKYIEYIERQQNRKKLLSEAKAQSEPINQVNVQEEQQKLIANNPDWISDGKPTEKYKEDMNSLSSYYSEMGFTQRDADLVNSNAVIAQAVIDAAKFRKTSKSNAEVEKRVRKAPVSTRPKQVQSKTLDNDIKQAKERAVKSGRPEDFVKLRRLQRQRKGE